MSSAEVTFGVKALERMAEAPSFNQWIYESIEPNLKGNILEIGSGIGNISSFLVKSGKNITLSDIDEVEISILKKKFYHYSNVQDILLLDIASINFENQFYKLKDSFHSIFLSNVLEHIENDVLALQHCSLLLKIGGTIVILVPAYEQLFSEMDKLLGHHRRYTKRSLNNLLTKNNFKVERCYYFNALGIAGWWWNKLFNKKEISPIKITIFNYLVPVAKIMDQLSFHKVGLSAVVIATKI